MTEAHRKCGVVMVFFVIGICIAVAAISIIGYTWFPNAPQRTVGLVTLWGALGCGVVASALAGWKL